MIISIKEIEYLTEIDDMPVVIRLKECYLFGKWKFRTEELHSYNQTLVNAFKIKPEPKKIKPIGFKTNNKTSKKKKKNEDKSKTN